ncbi:bifunctional adenosylcobinamide kinase/adenosylcobinamide-phosphate guanylyltransferase [Sphingomonas ginsenosidivorax]|uniref:Bifunctional adenosylcobalamin biosynthesis protein n=1 Tax=Sphingomonas ginsenosidivorax TaxID=862135 RepID=A0A5C6UG20_9SPHN|nr:bifunctional adenosylcobinamide kinase/adenosylcobinamide-phosphate guanylyltransferase [Sphingomonas ginsenosidivorax]TXC71380.1 bifunctional adenosylcobinamide kinase/adenosylcobinamide-phosphate guanylyltransferase [Sphingomonas ginsenosidivorax]
MDEVGSRTWLVLGGARSGKSRHAQRLAEAFVGMHVFIATAQAFDGEMRDRIARHRDDRDSRWQTVEAPLALAEAIRTADGADRVMLVDCLTLWVSNLLLGDHDIDAATDALVAAIDAASARIVFVSNEVGYGIVPDNALARRFRDVAGILNQRVAAVVDRVDLVAAGLPLRLK